MSTELRESLAQVQELLGRATPGPWGCGHGGKYEPTTSIYCDDAAGSIVTTCAHSMTVLVTREDEVANAALIAAAVNFLRTHGPELMKMLDRHGAGDAEDAARYRWLRDPARCYHLTAQRQPDGEFIAEGLHDEKLDAAIDAARAREGEK